MEFKTLTAHCIASGGVCGRPDRPSAAPRPSVSASAWRCGSPLELKAASGVLNCCVKRRSELWFWTHTGFRKFLDDVGLAQGGAEAGEPV